MEYRKRKLYRRCKGLFTRNVFSPCPLLQPLKFSIVPMDKLTILSIIHTVTIQGLESESDSESESESGSGNKPLEVLVVTEFFGVN